MADMEYKDFKPWHHSATALDETATPWLKKLPKKKKEQLRERIHIAIGFACEDYLRRVTENLPIKRELNAPVTEKDLACVIAQIRRDLKRMQGYVYGHKPMAFNRKNPYYRAGDEKAPFYSEAFLYPLLGKDDGRTVCYAFERLCEYVGLKSE